MEFICYPKCTTCIKARNWLIANNIKFNERNIKENNPTKDEIIKFHKLSNLDINKLFNTSGLLYKELNLKEKLKEMTLDENGGMTYLRYGFDTTELSETGIRTYFGVRYDAPAEIINVFKDYAQ